MYNLTNGKAVASGRFENGVPTTVGVGSVVVLMYPGRPEYVLTVNGVSLTHREYNRCIILKSGSRTLTVSNSLHTVAFIRIQVGAVLVDCRVQENEVLQRDAKLESEEVAMVTSLYVVPSAAVRVRTRSDISWNWCRGNRCDGGKDCGGRWNERLSWRRDTHLGAVQPVQIVTTRVDDPLSVSLRMEMMRASHSRSPGSMLSAGQR